MMALVWNIMNNLGEIVVYLPLKGATIPYFVERFVEPSLAFAAGWNYWYAYAILVAGTSVLKLSSSFGKGIFHFIRCVTAFSDGVFELLEPNFGSVPYIYDFVLLRFPARDSSVLLDS
jgi:hypothetical protein